MMTTELPCPVMDPHDPHPWNHPIVDEPMTCPGDPRGDEQDKEVLSNHHILIGITGWIGAGKDTVALRLKERWGFTVTHFADKLREHLYVLNPIINEYGERLQDAIANYGWQDAKSTYPEVRRLQQVYGTDVARHFNGDEYWVDQCLRDIDGPTTVADVRFPVEVGAINQLGHLWRVVRLGVEQDRRHVSETSLDHLGPQDFDFNIINSSSQISMLWQDVDDAIRRLVMANYTIKETAS